MASIPLPALTINPAKDYDPIGQYGKALALKSLIQNQAQQEQLRPLQLQQEQNTVQQQNQALKDQQAVTQSLLNWDGKNPGDLSHSILQNGGTGNAALSTAQHFLGIRKDTAEAIKNEGEGALDKSKALQSQYDTLAGHLNSLSQLPPAQLPSALMQAAQDWGQWGGNPSDVQHIQALGQLPPDQAKAQLPLYVKGLQGMSEQVTQGQKEAETAKAQADTAKTNVETQALQSVGGMTPPIEEAKYLDIQKRKNLGQPISAEDQATAKAYERNKTLNTQFQFNLQNAGVGGGQSGQPSAVAQAIANGSMKWGDVISPRTPMSVKTALLGEVKGINPNFNSGDFDVEKKVKEAFTSGNYSQQLNAINTARQHMQTFSDLADKLNNGDVQAANQIGNALGVQFGSDKATNFKIAAQAFGGEVGKAFDGAGVTQSERESASSAFNPNMSPAQLKGAVKTVDSLLQGKQNALKSTFQQGTQAKPNFGQPDQSTGGFNWDAHPKVNQ